MKKFFSLIMALVMVFSLSTAAFAATYTNTGESAKEPPYTETGDVRVAVSDGAVSATIYYVVVEWSGLTSFTYSYANEGTWDPEKHTYSGSSNAGWDISTAKNAITVTNHSNAQMEVTVTGPGTTNGITTTCTLNEDDAILSNASVTALNKPEDADKVTYDVSVNGTPEVSAVNNGIVSGGTITVQIAAYIASSSNQ